MSAVLVMVAPLAVAMLMSAACRRVALENLLARIGEPMTTTRARRLRLGRTDVSVLILGAAVGWTTVGVPGPFMAIAAVVGMRHVRARRERNVPAIVVQERTADAIGALAAAVRSGASLPQSIRYAAREASAPVAEELYGVVEALDTGVAMDRALAEWADRRPSPDTDLLIGALELHRTSGGDLPAVLDQVSRTIRDRVSVAREVRSLTAQARLSAWILGLLPIGFFAFLWVTSRRDIEGALTTPTGLTCIAIGLALEGGAFVWIRSLLEVG